MGSDYKLLCAAWEILLQNYYCQVQIGKIEKAGHVRKQKETKEGGATFIQCAMKSCSPPVHILLPHAVTLPNYCFFLPPIFLLLLLFFYLEAVGRRRSVSSLLIFLCCLRPVLLILYTKAERKTKTTVGSDENQNHTFCCGICYANIIFTYSSIYMYIVDGRINKLTIMIKKRTG